MIWAVRQTNIMCSIHNHQSRWFQNSCGETLYHGLCERIVELPYRHFWETIVFVLPHPVILYYINSHHHHTNVTSLNHQHAIRLEHTQWSYTQVYKPAIARSSLRLAPNVVIPSSLRSVSANVKNDAISIYQQHHNPFTSHPSCKC